MGEYIYVDYSNLFIEAQRISAVYNGQAENLWEAANTRTIDTNYRIDLNQLYHFLAGVRPKDVKRAVLFGSHFAPTDYLWALAQKAGFETIIHQRNSANREKRVDASMITELLRDAYTQADKSDQFRLVTGDGDYIPAVERLVADGFHVEVVFWNHASKRLTEACSHFRSMKKHLAHLKL